MSRLVSMAAALALAGGLAACQTPASPDLPAPGRAPAAMAPAADTSALAALLGPGMDACIDAARAGTQPSDAAFHEAGYTVSRLVDHRGYTKALGSATPGTPGSRYALFGFRKGHALCEITLAGIGSGDEARAWLDDELGQRGFYPTGRTDKALRYSDGKQALDVSSQLIGDTIDITLGRASEAA